MKFRPFHTIGRLMTTALILYLIVVAAAGIFQRSLLYFPDTYIGVPADHGLFDLQDIRLPMDDGTQVQAWYGRPSPGYPLIIYFHGNGGNLGYRNKIYTALTRQGFGLLALSYPGYGASEGKPSEQANYAAARAAIQYAAYTAGFSSSRTVYYGESLGTGVAVQMATEYAPGMVVLQSPFTSVLERAAEVYWFLPVSLLLQDRYESITKIAKMRTPLLLFHGEQDRIIPIRMGRALFDAANTPKRSIYYPEAGHEDFNWEVLAAEVAHAARGVRLITAP